HQNRQQNRRQTIENNINISTFEPTETRMENLDNKKSCPHDGYVLVTGGAGYIGSHTVLELLICGYNVIVIDNLSNACEESLIRVQKLARRPLKFYHANILDEKTLIPIFEKYNIWAVLHFAALKAVGESTKIPLDYYWNNVTGSLSLFRIMERFGVYNIVFSSSATVYGAHPSGIIGENPRGIPNNLMPYVSQVVQGRLPFVNIFGGDYDTVDGTAYNLGTGVGYSVLEIIQAMSKACGKEIPYKITKRRPGDIGVVTADASLANVELGWYPKYNLDHMCQDLWRWIESNPLGYPEPSNEAKQTLQKNVNLI
ncbi:4307_t:CDS:2, partial [Racocetra fulgida]